MYGYRENNGSQSGRMGLPRSTPGPPAVSRPGSRPGDVQGDHGRRALARHDLGVRLRTEELRADLEHARHGVAEVRHVREAIPRELDPRLLRTQLGDARPAAAPEHALVEALRMD